MKPLTYMPVEGVYGRHAGWQDVVLCKDCLRVVGRIRNLRAVPSISPFAPPSSRPHWTWEWVREAKAFCPWCGFRLQEVPEPRYWRGLRLDVVARWHSTSTWWPSTWGAGHWEVRDFEQIRAPSPKAETA